MPNSKPEILYTYRAGRKVALEKQPDQFVVRALPEKLRELGIVDAEQVSSASSRVTTRRVDLEPMMSSARSIAPTHHAYTLSGSGQEFLITDRILVTFKKPMTAEDVARFAGRYGLVLRKEYSETEFLFQLTDHTGMNPVKLVVKLSESDPDVAIAEHDLNRRMKVSAPPTDPSYAAQWHLHRHLQDAEYDSRSSTRCEDAWQLLGGFGSSDVVIGVTDDGCKLDHSDFDSPGKFANWGYFEGTRLVKRDDFDADAGKMYESGSDHGTACAGVIAAETDSARCVGAAPGCRLLPVKWQSQGPYLSISDTKLLDVLNWVANKVDVLSNSWGGAPDNTWTLNVVSKIQQLAQTGGRRGRGIVFLWAAGNENCPIEFSGAIDIPYTSGWEQRADGSWVWVGVETSRSFQSNLVGVPGVAHIAALASTAQRSHYSNYGTGIILCAPSSNSHEYGRLPVAGLEITTTSGESGGITSSFGGTSSATPLVAGIAALVISANPQLSAVEVLSVLKKTASKDLDTDGYPKTPPANFDLNPTWDVSPVAPFATPAFQNNGDADGTWSPWFGHGRIDALAAVAVARDLGGADDGGGTGDSGSTLRFRSTAAQAIPDADPQGIRAAFTTQDARRANGVRVSVDIQHGWIGDLRIQLVGPDGTTATLHDRTGSSADDLKRTFTAADTPGLAAFRDKVVAGEWKLVVQDLAADDEGILNECSLELDLAAAPLLAEDAASARIPDEDPAGVVRKLDLATGATIADIAVAIDITHSWIGDLRVSLVPPGGAPIVLHERAGRDADNILRVWRSQDTAALAALRGKSAGGKWELRVVDLAADDEGKLNRWSIAITAQGVSPAVAGTKHAATIGASTAAGRGTRS